MENIRKPGEYMSTKSSMPIVPEIPAGIFSGIRRAVPAKRNIRFALTPCISGRAVSPLHEGEAYKNK
jgi:hypothetical protein